MMAFRSGTLRCARLGNFICHRWHSPHQMLDNTLHQKQANRFQYLVIVNSLSTFYKNNNARQSKAKAGSKISLYTENGKLITIELEAAQKMAKRRMLTLTKMREDSMSETPIYKLISKNEITDDMEEVTDDGKNSLKKAVKTLRLSGRISPHDIDIKMKKLQDLLEKKYKCLIQIKCEEHNAKMIESIRRTIKKLGVIVKEENKRNSVFIFVQPCDNSDHAQEHV